MVDKVIILPSAEKEIEEAFDWYEERQEGLGERFVYSVERQLKRIATNPEHYPIKKRNYRESNIEVFPYLIVFKYYANKRTTVIITVFHTSRKPNKKYKR